MASPVEAATHGPSKLPDRTLRGMLDELTTVTVDWCGSGIVLNLSAGHNDPGVLTLEMLATTAWLQTILANPRGPCRLRVLNEAWSLLDPERTTKYLQACWKLSRAYGVANLAILHRLSYLRAQADDGSTASKVSLGSAPTRKPRWCSASSPTRYARPASSSTSPPATPRCLPPSDGPSVVEGGRPDRRRRARHRPCRAPVLRHGRPHGQRISGPSSRPAGPPPTRPIDSGDANLGRVAIGAILLLGGGEFVAWAGAQTACILFGDGPLPVSTADGLAAALALPDHASEPAVAWPPAVRGQLPGAVAYWVSTAIIALATVALVGSAIWA